MDKYSWSFIKDETVYTQTGESIEECLFDAKSENYGSQKKVYIGENEPVQIDLNIDVDSIIDDMDCTIQDICPWSADMGYWSNGISEKDTEALGKALNDTFKKWLQDTKNEPSYFRVINVVEYQI